MVIEYFFNIFGRLLSQFKFIAKIIGNFYSNTMLMLNFIWHNFYSSLTTIIQIDNFLPSTFESQSRLKIAIILLENLAIKHNFHLYTVNSWMRNFHSCWRIFSCLFKSWKYVPKSSGQIKFTVTSILHRKCISTKLVYCSACLICFVFYFKTF